MKECHFKNKQKGNNKSGQNRSWHKAHGKFHVLSASTATASIPAAAGVVVVTLAY
jgi:hypothetical protein